MDTDLILVVGIVALVLAVPTLLSAWVDGALPRGAAFLVLLGGGMIAFALTHHAGGYSFAGLPQVFARVIGRWVN